MHNIYVYLLDNFNGFDETFITRNLDRLPAFRREQCLQYRYPGDRIRCIASFLLLEKGLREQYGITQQVSFVYHSCGKPYLRECPERYFNISHCKNAVVCALSELEIGADIQEPRPYDHRLTKRVCNDKELQQLAASDDPARLFCEMWTKRESYAKARGISVTDVLQKELPEYGFWSLEKTEYYLSLYHGENDPNMHTIHVDVL